MSKAVHAQSDRYARKEYWEERFADEDEFDWLGTLDDFAAQLDLTPHSTILVLGCGSSTLSDELTRRGHFVISTDYSSVVCHKQKERHAYEYTVADCGAAIHRQSFDLVIEKGVIDALVGIGFLFTLSTTLYTS